MTVDEAVKKACDHFDKMGLEVPNVETIYGLALLFMMEELIRVISSRLSSEAE